MVPVALGSCPTMVRVLSILSLVLTPKDHLGIGCLVLFYKLAGKPELLAGRL